MLIESLARLSIIQAECIEKNIIVSSPEFMKETQDIIDAQIDIVKKDLSFQQENAGPYSYGIGKYTINIFPPVYTESGDWVIILFNEESQIKEELYIFHSIYGLIENLINAFKHIENASKPK